MAEQAIVHHRLDLLLRLIDSVTGRSISDNNIQLNTNPVRKLNPVARDNGIYLFIGIGRTDFELDIHVYGYESRKVQIRFEDLDENMPMKEVCLLPKANPAQKDSILTLRGRMPGIKEIEAVSLSDGKYSFKEFDSKKKILHVLNQHNAKIKDVYYGIIDTSAMEYEKIEVDKEINDHEIRLKKQLEKEYTINQPITRIIFGQTDEDGEYMLKVPAGMHSEYLIRYVVEETVYFKKVNLNNPDEQSL